MLVACATRLELKSVASISNNTNWKIIEDCGYGGCYPLVDYLIGENIKIRVQAHNDLEKDYFLIQLFYSSGEIDKLSFDPAKVSLRHNDRVLVPKPFMCSYTVWDHNYLKHSAPLAGKIPLEDIDCFLLFFDELPPPIEDTFSLNIEGLYKREIKINIPEITFQKGLRK